MAGRQVAGACQAPGTRHQGPETRASCHHHYELGIISIYLHTYPYRAHIYVLLCNCIYKGIRIELSGGAITALSLKFQRTPQRHHDFWETNWLILSQKYNGIMGIWEDIVGLGI